MTKGSTKNKQWLSGNEAIARGAWEAGVTVASGYPGTPSTEILENLCTYKDVYTEWAPNEKVALEVGLGASFAGARVLVTMKHVGLNVAADPLFTAAYTGVRGGIVIITADDPEMHSSQNEQDNRNYAYAAKLPMLEPSDPAEALELLKKAFEISEEFDTPVLFRTTTRVAHVKGLVATGKRKSGPVPVQIEKMPAKFVMLPGNARVRRRAIAERMARLAAYVESFSGNRREAGTTKQGFVTGGVSYLYVKEAFPEAAVLKIATTWPLPLQMIRDFAGQVDELIVVEELDPFLETHIKASGIACLGKARIPAMGELNPFILKKALGRETGEVFAPVDIPPRPPNMCPGCPHRGLFYSLGKQDVFISGDIGCYTLGFLPPLSAMDSCVCMGASIGVAHGMDKALGEKGRGKTVAVIGDSTFMHSGITGLVNMVYNSSASTVIILDNRITAMTGHQPNPASGSTIMDEPAKAVNLENLCRAIGVNHVRLVNPHDIKECRKVLKEEIERPEPSVIIAQSPCVLLPEERKRRKFPLASIQEKCTGCGTCIRLGCPAINWVPLTAEEARQLGKKEKQKGFARISIEMCNGCGQCLAVCKFKAIKKAEDIG